MKPPRVSFVIPAYNAEAYLAQAILSCRGQSIKELEIVVVNDGSEDGTKDLICWHMEQDSRIHLVDFVKNQGVVRPETLEMPMHMRLIFLF